MKLWDKGFEINKLVEQFTIGLDKEMDLYLAEADILGSIAHVRMLESINLLKKEEMQDIVNELINIYNLIKTSGFKMEAGIEDVHSQLELMLSKKLGEAGKKVHSGRSRNDQVLVDLKIFFRTQIAELAIKANDLFVTLQELSEKHKNKLMPGYTHLQVAMPSSFGLWFGAYAESLVDDMILLQAAYKIVNQNPLGAGAGSGSSFPLNRAMTTELLGFETLDFNVVYAHMGRGKTEKSVAFALASFASTLAKMAMDVCLFVNQNFDFVSIPKELTTGSSIMPHKKNPDVFELIRAKCNKLQALPNEIALVTTNLPSGYFRDMQILKESIFPAFEELKNCMKLATIMLRSFEIKENILDDPKYKYIFSVEEVNKKVLEGVPFRDAYKIVAEEIETGKFNPSKSINHTHEGSIGNLCNREIAQKMELIYKSFNFEKAQEAVNKLLIRMK